MAQKLIRCEAGHIYDSAVHARCPECGEPQETTCERGHVYDPASHASCPTCQEEDRLAKDGRISHTPGPGTFVPIGAGQWTCSGENEIVLRWDGGQFLDRLTLSWDGTRLNGRNNLGWPVTGTRQYAQRSAAPQPPPGIMPPPQRRTRR